jgi:signal transduction histidine kinase
MPSSNAWADVSDLRDLRGRLSDEQVSMLHDVGDVLDVGVLVVDRNLVVTGWNGWLERATRKRSTSVVGRPVSEVEPNLRPSSYAALEQAVQGMTVLLSHRLHEYLIDIPSPPGLDRFSRMQQSVRILPVQSADGTVTGAAALIQDVTERVAHEQELRSAMEEAQGANKVKSEFLAAMSHELRTPIGAMSAYADLLADGIFGEVSPEQREPLVRIKSVGQHLLGIVEQILTFARIEAGRETVRAEDVDAVRVCREAIVAVEPLVAKKQLALSTLFASEEIPMRTDAVKLRQILINLLGNAVKFTQRGAIGIEVTTPTSDDISFAIRDTGPGIAPSDLARIFDPFIQASASHNRSHGGTGLGLSVSRELTRLLGGDLVVSSELGAGSIFTVTLPRHATA